VATGFLGLGSLLSLDGDWQKVGEIRILLGDAAGRKTRKELVEAFERQNNESPELCKTADDSLAGIDAVRSAHDARKIRIGVYTRERFHLVSKGVYRWAGLLFR
jgi:hypothetical protein